MATLDTIVIGASAGGVQALLNLVADLPPDLPAAVFIVLHIPTDVPSMLPEILARDAKLPVGAAKNHEEIRPGRVYVAPPDHHLLIERQHIKLVHGPKENFHRPSIDVLFRSAARWAGPKNHRSDSNRHRTDGAAGMADIKRRGGITVIQDPLGCSIPQHAGERPSVHQGGLFTTATGDPAVA